jgi:hypothetical protein
VCDPARSNNPTQDDRAYPIGLVRASVSNLGWDGTGFLAWDPGQKSSPKGTVDAIDLESEFQEMVSAVGETGCGYEASLESWYRFLIDPEPPLSVASTTNGAGSMETVTMGIDQTLLDLRAKFLRPDSLVVIAMLTDENDCSIRDEKQSWIVGQQTYGGEPFRLPRSTSICGTDPDHECCTSCSASVPAGCSPDPVCDVPLLTGEEDWLNLRCHRQKERFGFDLLHPISRYVDGLTKKTVVTASGDRRENPLYAGSARDASMVFLVGILGVPWPDVASTESFAPSAPLRYLTYEELERQQRFDWMLAADATSFPRDGLMVESTADRTTVAGLPQKHPGTGDALAASGSGAAPGSNPINGKELTVTTSDELQYACIFPLPVPRPNCTNEQSCDCPPNDAPRNRPICSGTTQTHAKAYPSVRQIEVLRGVGRASQNAVIASICPKIADPEQKSDPSYGYTPAISAIVESLRSSFARSSCLEQPLPVCGCVPTDSDDCGAAVCEGLEPGQTDCAVVEAWLPAPGAVCPPCDGNAELPGRTALSAEATSWAHAELARRGACEGSSGVNCEDVCVCGVEQLAGAELTACKESLTTPMDAFGFCYVDPARSAAPDQASAAKAIVARCAEPERRVVRFVGGLPSRDSVTLIQCPDGLAGP